MNKKAQLTNIVLFSIIGILLIGAVFAYNYTSNKEPVFDGNTNNKISCSVYLEEDYFGKDVKIKSFTCAPQGQCFGGSNLGIFVSEGNIEMLANGVVLDSEIFETGFFSGEAVKELSICTKQTSGQLRVKTGSDITDTKTWSVI